MKKINKNQRGFTLIELLMVVAIIGLVSSIIFTGLHSARLKAKDAAVKAGMSQISNLMELNFNQYGTYCNLQPGQLWFSAYTTCDAALASGYWTGDYAIKMKDICNDIYKNSSSVNDPYRTMTYIDSAYSCSNSYSWMAGLNNGKWYCSGSSGKSEHTGYDGVGCYLTP